MTETLGAVRATYQPSDAVPGEVDVDRELILTLADRVRRLHGSDARLIVARAIARDRKERIAAGVLLWRQVAKEFRRKRGR